MENAPEQIDTTTKTTAYVIYGLYLGSIVLPMLSIIAIIFAYIFENDAQGILKSHYQFLIRTFWLGLLYFAFAGASIVILIGFFLLPLCVIWWLVRSARGLKSLMRSQPIGNPTSWLI